MTAAGLYRSVWNVDSGQKNQHLRLFSQTADAKEQKHPGPRASAHCHGYISVPGRKRR